MDTVILVGFLIYFANLCNAQATRAFNCALPNLCNDNVIDPRAGAAVTTNIVSPTSCIPPYVQCTNIVCGTPSVPIGSQDGLATQNSFPWAVYLQNDSPKLYAGGGVLIDQYHVLTAAHKISNISTSMTVIMGMYNPQNAIETGRQTSKVTEALIHSGYNEKFLKDDVAILRLASPMNISGSVMTICLPSFGSKSYVTNPATRCVVAGWGQTAFSKVDAPTQTLKQAHVPIVNGATCTQSYNGIIGATNTAQYLDTSKEICAGGEAQLDSCTQDGGSGLVCNDSPTTYSLAGLVLWGKDCGQPNRYGVYLNVPSYLSWIQAIQSCVNANPNWPTCPNSSLKTFS